MLRLRPLSTSLLRRGAIQSNTNKLQFFNLHPNIHIINLQNGIIKEYNADGYINITSSIRGPKKINVRNERK